MLSFNFSSYLLEGSPKSHRHFSEQANQYPSGERQCGLSIFFEHPIGPQGILQESDDDVVCQFHKFLCWELPQGLTCTFGNTPKGIL